MGGVSPLEFGQEHEGHKFLSERESRVKDLIVNLSEWSTNDEKTLKFLFSKGDCLKRIRRKLDCGVDIPK